MDPQLDAKRDCGLHDHRRLGKMLSFARRDASSHLRMLALGDDRSVRRARDGAGLVSARWLAGMHRLDERIRRRSAPRSRATRATRRDTARDRA
jgi:hypothetical protein